MSIRWSIMQNLVDVVEERPPAEFDNDFAQAHMQNEKVFWVPTLSARHYFFMNAGFEWNVLMIKVIKASMRSCLGAFGLGKVAPKLKKKAMGLLLSYIWWKWKLHFFRKYALTSNHSVSNEAYNLVIFFIKVKYFLQEIIFAAPAPTQGFGN